MTYIFISYSKENIDFARHLRTLLEREGFKIWVDEAEIEPGKTWWRTIEGSIENCAAFLVIMSPAAQDSDWVEREILLAEKLKKPIFPVLFSGDYWSRLANIQYEDMTPGTSGVLPPRLINALRKHMFHTGGDLPVIPVSAAKILPPPFAWVEIPAGPVTLEAGGYIKEKTTFQVPAFAIAKYPITNAQYSEFVRAGGYAQQKWWTDAGWEARQEGIEWGSKSKSWKASRKPWNEPRFWKDEKWNEVDYPVVGVSWYEALAFCRWLSEVTCDSIMLPTEQQWQRAAQALLDGRDSGYIYPWGNEWDSICCNSFESGIGKTTPVRQYEGKGDSPCGVSDLAGNVWEWCLTAYETGSIDIDKVDVRSLRGGSWGINTSNIRASYRIRLTPGNWDLSTGFRCARPLSKAD